MSTTTRPAGSLRVRRGGRAVAEGRRPDHMAEDEEILFNLMVMNTARTPLPAGRTPALAPLGR
jgi:hypothetical protein